MSEINSSIGGNKSLNELINKEDVQLVVNCAIGPQAKIIDYYVKNYSDESVGFLGSHRYLVVTIQIDSKKETDIHTFFLKHVPYDNAEQASVIFESKVFYKETTFYKHIAPELLSGIKDKSWCAQCYLVKDDVLIFEDLKSKNYSNKPKVLDIVALKAALTALAKLHGASMIAEHRLGKSLNQIYPEAFEECLFVRNGRFSEFYRTGVDVCVAIAKHLGLDSTIVSKVMDRIFEAMTASKTRRNVACHGDSWSNNFMFNDSQPLPNCVLVDFQQLRYVPMMTDVVQLIYVTTRNDFRALNEKCLLAHYHKILCETLRDEGIISPSLNDIIQDYETRRFVGVVTAALYFPLILVDPKLCVEFTKESDGFAHFIFGDRVDLVMSFMKDSHFNDRISETINELVGRADEFLNAKL